MSNRIRNPKNDHPKPGTFSQEPDQFIEDKEEFSKSKQTKRSRYELESQHDKEEGQKKQNKSEKGENETQILGHDKRISLDIQGIIIGRFEHGSEDSRDLDVAYLVDPNVEFPDLKWRISFCSQKIDFVDSNLNSTSLTSIIKSMDEDRNLFQVEESAFEPKSFFVSKTHRGPPDEVNNGLLSTHRSIGRRKIDTIMRQTIQATSDVENRHGSDGQKLESNSVSSIPFPLPFPVSKKVERCVLLRYIIAAKSIIVRMRHLEQIRAICLEALASWNLQVYLKTIESDCIPYVSHLTKYQAKQIAFQATQALLLSFGIEVFSKASLTLLIPCIHSLIYYTGDGEENISSVHDLEVLKTVMRLFRLAGRNIRQHSQFKSNEKKHQHNHSNSGSFCSIFYLDRSNIESSGSLEMGVQNYLLADSHLTQIDLQSERLISPGIKLPVYHNIDDKVTDHPVSNSSQKFHPMFSHSSCTTFLDDISIPDYASSPILSNVNMQIIPTWREGENEFTTGISSPSLDSQQIHHHDSYLPKSFKLDLLFSHYIFLLSHKDEKTFNVLDLNFESSSSSEINSTKKFSNKTKQSNVSTSSSSKLKQKLVAFVKPSFILPFKSFDVYTYLFIPKLIDSSHIEHEITSEDKGYSRDGIQILFTNRLNLRNQDHESSQDIILKIQNALIE